MTRSNVSPDDAIVLATIYGEAANSSPAAWAAIAHVIMNRVGKFEWRHLTMPVAVVMHSGFDACSQQTPLYQKARKYFVNRSAWEPDAHLENMAAACFPIISGLVTDNTQGATMYYSPKAQAALHESDPIHYRIAPPWDFSLLAQCFPPGLLPSDDFLFFAYLK